MGGENEVLVDEMTRSWVLGWCVWTLDTMGECGREGPITLELV